MKLTLLTLLAPLVFSLPAPERTLAASAKPEAIVLPAGASFQENLAAREVRRYAYLRTGQLLPIVTQADGLPKEGGFILVARKGRPAVASLASESGFADALAAIPVQGYWLKTIDTKAGRVLLITGTDDSSTLYAAYRFAEHLGVRFYLHGDVVPDERIPLKLPVLDEKAAPLFTLRGIQPFHDFPEGPDWWNRDDYLAIISQLPKLRMNFIALHTYPEGAPNAEPTVWIGHPGDIGENGQVRSSYPASYMSTARGNWGYAPKKTSDYAFGAAELFERDDFGAEVMWGHLPQPTNSDGCNEVFARSAELLRDAFTHARQLGVKTCVGTETPLTVPKEVKARLQSQGLSVTNSAVIEELYEGIFKRIAQTYPLDYYWFWTPEGWTWSGTKTEQIAATTNDLFAAIKAHRKVRAPFALATCGWVLGPQQDRALFDKLLPKNVAVSCINREVGRTPVDSGFADVSGRGKWAIPWLEDDPALTSPQLWAGRMRRDAADALRYGCNGLMGIHWRTRVLGPAVSALAEAAWQQGDWATAAPSDEAPVSAGAVGGQPAGFPNSRIEGTDEAPVYRSVRYNLSAYHLPLSNGAYTVTLKFCEPHYSEAGKRVFGVALQGRLVIENLDIFAKVGKDRALDFTFDAVAVTNGWLKIRFEPTVEFPSIAGIVVKGPGFTQKINCGGEAWNDYAADSPPAPAAPVNFPPTEDFYRAWAVCEFGEKIGERAAQIFAKIDGYLPRPSDWIQGPGGTRPDKRPWDQVRKDYAFVDEFAALAPEVKGAGQVERFDYWLNTFRYMRAMGELNCAWAVYSESINRAKTEKDPDARRAAARQSALPLRKKVVTQTGEVYRHLLALLSNTGELGTVCNWEQHLLPDLLTKPGNELAQLLGEPLPADAQPAKGYRGPTRVIVPTLRTAMNAGEKLNLKVLILSEQAPTDAAVYWRPMGRGQFVKVPLTHVARGVFSAQVGGIAEDFEYYAKVTPGTGPSVQFPAGAPELSQTVVVTPSAR